MIYQALGNLDAIFNTSLGLGLVASYLAGVLVSFSPCIYPMIPITLGIVGAAATSSKLKGFLLSLVFVLGVAFIYSFLGAVSSLIGTLLGAIVVNPLTYLFLMLVFIILGFAQIGVLPLKIPFFSIKYKGDYRSGLLGIFVLGAISGLAMIPCNFPVLFSILNLIALRKNVLYGIIALFVFSLGYGTILIILGTFTSLIRKLPKEGPWAIIVQKIAGVILLGVGGYYAYKFIQLIR
jgi:thiol:disulfide interchange protein